MARFYAQVFLIPFLLLGVLGLFLGDYGSVNGAGQHGGNLGSIDLESSPVRDFLELLIAAALVVVGFVIADRRTIKLVTIVVGVVLVLLAIAGFAKGSDGFAGMHFSPVVDIIFLGSGILAVLSGLGTLEDEGPQSVLRA